MQQRFCKCGCAIWVQYLFPGMNCQIIFKSRGESRDFLTMCPCCGKKLRIEELR